MAMFLDTQTQQSTRLCSQHVFGRHSGLVTTVLTNPEASRVHASVNWNGSHWLLQDNSSNGTYINGHHYIKGAKHRLIVGDKINFGSLKSTTWTVLELGAPSCMLVPQAKHLEAIELEGIMLLPNEQAPEFMLYQSQHGQWMHESVAGILPLKNGDQVQSSECSWVFVDAAAFDATQLVQQEHALPCVAANFNVSQNEEHVALKLSIDGTLLDLGNRTHHYLLLLLARQRIADNAAGFSDSEKGWIDKNQLSKSLGMEETHINTQIYRFKQQILQALPANNTHVQPIERRRGELRFAYDEVCINGECA